MFSQELQNAAVAQGWRVNPQTGAVTGVCDGVAFRALAEDGLSLELSASIGEKQIPKLSAKFSQACPGSSVQPAACGVRIDCPASPQTGEAFVSLVHLAAKTAVSHIEVAHDDKFERYGEPFYVYLRGAAGALLGALVGAVPWFLIGGGWFSMWLGALISMASFYGYRLFKGAHHTTFATATVVLFSLLAMFGAEFCGMLLDYVRTGYYTDVAQAFAAMMAGLEGGGLWTLLRSMLVGLIFGLIGLFSIRKYISVYTHEPRFLRSRGHRRDK